MGSANLNDRSQKGDGDSEIALVVEDTNLIASEMDGRPYQASRFAASLRRKLFRSGHTHSDQTCVSTDITFLQSISDSFLLNDASQEMNPSRRSCAPALFQTMMRRTSPRIRSSWTLFRRTSCSDGTLLPRRTPRYTPRSSNPFLPILFETGGHTRYVLTHTLLVI